MKIEKVYLPYLLVPAFITGLLLLTYLDFSRGYSVNNNWTFGDWLINYSSGFIRRGLIGQLAIQFSNPKLFVMFLHIFFCLSIYSCFYLIIKKMNFPQEYLIAMVAPAFLIFPILDPIGGFRKEIIGLSLLAVSSLSKVAWKTNTRKIFYVVTVGSFPLFILMHEIIAVFLPIIILINIDILESKKYFIFTILATLISFATFCIVLLLPAINLEDIKIICAPLHGFCNTNPVENGAITWLIHSKEYGYEQVIKLHYNLASISRYIASWLLLVPLIYTLRIPLGKVTEKTTTFYLFLSFLLGVFILHFVAIDYGRFIYIVLSSLVFIALSFSSKSESKSILITPSFLALTCIYLPFWNIHHVWGLSLSPIAKYILP